MLTAQSGIGKTDRELAVEVSAIALKERVLFNRDLNVQIAIGATRRARLTLSTEAYAVSRINTWGNFDRERFCLFHQTLTAAHSTGFFNDLPPTPAGRASLLHLEEALLHSYLSRSATGSAGFD
tara:strand:- start:176 stop:547 length:372 start_codon:yes stop_codon:yes gene_type:complete